ncbi:MAG: cupin [Thermodesulfobacteriota bacterium]
MPIIIKEPTVIEAAGNKPKIIEEFIGRAASGTAEVSVARMKSPGGWAEPAQAPEFDEYTVVLKGVLRVECGGDIFDVSAGEAIIVRGGERVAYSTPAAVGAEYIAVCLPAFSPDTVNRESDC